MQIRSSSSELTVLPCPAKMVSLPQEEVTSFAAGAGQTHPAKAYQSDQAVKRVLLNKTEAFKLLVKILTNTILDYCIEVQKMFTFSHYFFFCNW